MRVIIKKISLFALIFIYILVGLLVHFAAIILPKLRFRIMSKCTKLICISLRKILKIKVVIEGNVQYIREKGNFIVANHQGYLDGVILAGIFPLVFVSKLQVKSWPIFGWMARVGGTIFINRQKKLKSADSIEEISRTLRHKVNVLVFPEGTSTDGAKILPFQTIFFQAPLNSGAGIIPVTIQYIKINSQEVSLLNRDKVCWYGQKNFLQHMKDVLALESVEAKITIHPKITIAPNTPGQDLRKQISATAHQIISENFSFINH